MELCEMIAAAATHDAGSFAFAFAFASPGWWTFPFPFPFAAFAADLLVATFAFALGASLA